MNIEYLYLNNRYYQKMINDTKNNSDMIYQSLMQHEKESIEKNSELIVSIFRTGKKRFFKIVLHYFESIKADLNLIRITNDENKTWKLYIENEENKTHKKTKIEPFYHPECDYYLYESPLDSKNLDSKKYVFDYNLWGMILLFCPQKYRIQFTQILLQPGIYSIDINLPLYFIEYYEKEYYEKEYYEKGSIYRSRISTILMVSLYLKDYSFAMYLFEKNCEITNVNSAIEHVLKIMSFKMVSKIIEKNNLLWHQAIEYHRSIDIAVQNYSSQISSKHNLKNFAPDFLHSLTKMKKNLLLILPFFVQHMQEIDISDLGKKYFSKILAIISDKYVYDYIEQYSEHTKENIDFYCDVIESIFSQETLHKLKEQCYYEVFTIIAIQQIHEQKNPKKKQKQENKLFEIYDRIMSRSFFLIK